MPRGSKELTNSRKDEIVGACAKLYETMSFKEITIKEIAKLTSFTRTSIYNYYQTKEEIFLALLKREYDCWIGYINTIKKKESMTKEEFAKELAHSLEQKQNMLKLLSMNMYDIEENSRLEQLIEFKKSYGDSLKAVRECLDKFFIEMDDKEKQDFIFSFFPFIFGIYPYTVVTEKQRKAMELAKVDYLYMSIYDITYTTIKKLLGVE